MNQPLVSVVISSHDYGRYVTAAVDSVLGQTLRDFEIVVVDNGSSDDTRQRLAAYRPPVRYLHQEDLGVSGGRNRGIVESRGRYVALLDADDAWLPNKLEKQLEILAKDRRSRVSYTACFIADSELRPVRPLHYRRYDDLASALVLHGNVVGIPSSVLVDRTLFDDVGHFDRDLGYCSDWDMWVRLAFHSTFAYVDEPLVLYRQHGSNMTRNPAPLERESRRILKKAFGNAQAPARLRSLAPSAEGRMWMVLSGCYFHAGQFRDAIRCAARSIARDPRQLARLFGYPTRRLRGASHVPY